MVVPKSKAVLFQGQKTAWGHAISFGEQWWKKRDNNTTPDMRIPRIPKPASRICRQDRKRVRHKSLPRTLMRILHSEVLFTIEADKRQGKKLLVLQSNFTAGSCGWHFPSFLVWEHLKGDSIKKNPKKPQHRNLNLSNLKMSPDTLK